MAVDLKVACIDTYNIVEAAIDGTVELGFINFPSVTLASCIEIEGTKEDILLSIINGSDISSNLELITLLFDADRLCLIDQNAGLTDDVGDALPEHHKHFENDRLSLGRRQIIYIHCKPPSYEIEMVRNKPAHRLL